MVGLPEYNIDCIDNQLFSTDKSKYRSRLSLRADSRSLWLVKPISLVNQLLFFVMQTEMKKGCFPP